MISNDDQIGNYFVFVFARKNSIAQFQCPSLLDAEEEVARVAGERRAKGLPTSRATATRMKGKSGKIRLYDDPIEIAV